MTTAFKTRRHGAIFLEALVAMTIVLLAIGAVAQFIALTVRQRQHLERMFVATNECANVMETLYATSWDQLIDRREDWNDISATAKKILDEPRMRVVIEPSDEDMGRCKRLRVEITWLDGSGQRVDPVKLSAWKYQGEHQ